MKTGDGGRAGWLGPRGVLAALILCAVVYVAAALPIARTGAVISPDCGARLLQVQALHEHWPDWSIPYPAAQLDPTRRNSPLSFYEFVHNGKTYTFYSFLFALISARLSGWFGFFGLLIVPILSGLVTGLATYGLARRLGLRYAVAPMVTAALLTPLLLFGVVFWDPTVIAAFAAVCLYLAVTAVQTGRPLLWLAVGLTLGVGLWFHELIIAYLPALAVGAVWAYRRQCLKPVALLALGAAALLIPLALVNHAVYGAYSGPHLQNNRLGSAESVSQLLLDPTLWGPAAFYTLFGWGDTNPAYSWQLRDWMRTNPRLQFEYLVSVRMAVPVILWAYVGATGLWRKRWVWIAGVALLLGIIADAWWVYAHKDLPHSLFYVCPLVALAFAARLPERASEASEAPGDPRRLWQFVGITAAVFTGLELLLPTLGGTEWGARYLMIPTPALVLFAWRAVEGLLAIARSPERSHERVGAWGLLTAAAALALATVGMQVVGYQRILEIHGWNQQLTRDVLSRPAQVVVTTSWWAPLNAAPAYPQRQFLFAGDAMHPAPELFLRLRAAEVRSFTLLGYGPWELSNFSMPMGYAPDPTSVRQSTHGLWLCRYDLRTREPGVDPSTPPPVRLR